jgi:hypothetical protein
MELRFRNRKLGDKRGFEAVKQAVLKIGGGNLARPDL